MTRESTEAPPALRDRLRRWMEVALAGAPSVSHDGTEVLYVSDTEGLPLPYRVPADGGPAALVRPGSERVAVAHASPTGPRAVVAADSGGNEHWQLELVEWSPDGGDPAGPPRPLTQDPGVIHLPGQWHPDGRHYYFASNQRDRRFFDVHQVDVARPGQVRAVFRQDSRNVPLAVRGDRLLVGRMTTNLDVDLFLVEADRVVHLNPHEGEVTVHSATIGADGVYAAANPGRELAAVVRYRPGGSTHEFVREYPHEVEIVRADPGGGRLAVVVNRDGWSELHLLDVRTREDRALPVSPRGVIGALEWFPDGLQVAYDLSCVAGQEVYRRSVETGKARQLSRSARPVPAVLREPRLARVRTTDRVEVPYWEYLPPSGAPRGTLLWVHGGPEAQARPGFSPVIGFLVQEGWRVVAPNVRGSTGYGRTFVHLDDVRKRMDSVRDLKEVVEALLARGAAAPGRLGVVGGSYGGFMVLSAAATYPELFGAAVDLVGIANFVTFLERTGPWRRKLREDEYGRLDTDREFLEAISPLGHAERIRAPLLVIHGRNDPRVPASEAEQIVESLERRGRPVELLIFEDEGHGIVRRENRLTAWSRAAAFLARHLDGAG